MNSITKHTQISLPLSLKSLTAALRYVIAQSLHLFFFFKNTFQGQIKEHPSITSSRGNPFPFSWSHHKSWQNKGLCISKLLGIMRGNYSELQKGTCKFQPKLWPQMWRITLKKFVRHLEFLLVYEKGYVLTLSNYYFSVYERIIAFWKNSKIKS